MPQLGESVTEGTITRWLKAEGDEVEQDEPIAEVDTDKVNTELPSPLAGTPPEAPRLRGDDGGRGGRDRARRHRSRSARYDSPPRENVAADAPTEEFPAAATEAQPPPAENEREHAVTGARGRETRLRAATDGRRSRRRRRCACTRSSPVVRRLAAEHEVQIAEIPGTGTGGRVTKKDIEGYVEQRGAEHEGTRRPGLQEEREAVAPPEPDRVAVYEGDRVEELTGSGVPSPTACPLSKVEIPHAWTLVEVDLTGLAALRAREKEDFAGREGVKLTYLPFIVKAAVEGLKEFPILNSVWDGDRIVLRKGINVGIAVDLDEALVVPVIRNADELNLVGLARRIDDVVKRARAGNSAPRTSPAAPSPSTTPAPWAASPPPRS